MAIYFSVIGRSYVYKCAIWSSIFMHYYKHLLDIASENDVLEQRVYVGKHKSFLLRKIEELIFI